MYPTTKEVDAIMEQKFKPVQDALNSLIEAEPVLSRKLLRLREKLRILRQHGRRANGSV